MTRLRIAVDDEALAEAAESLGTETVEETIRVALREVVERHKRLREGDDDHARHTRQ
ncbi:type II toxin-antitoxin system VapB family antitoxin [Streptomyces sp. NPDC014870]|uniref:type II toxin-antitoxin system VapB family antitoxin n=1 Tax=Streptomyces sp. NPDC014870 TaxID=3364925 RepID=UPI0036FBB466